MRSWPSPDVPVLADLGIGPSDQPVRARDTSTHELTEIGTGQADVSIYVCGITPYDATHLGHAATYLLFDTLERVLLDAGKRVHYVQNVTDIDDPLLERAAATGEDWAELAERETELFRTDMTALRILAPQAYVGAVEAIPDITAAISELQDRGAAYDLDDDIYFSVAAAPHFGEVGRLDSEQMVALSAERGGDPHRPGKKDPLDCLLWQGARPGEPSWDSVVGAGRPGWHVECAAIARRHLGAVIDVQGGGDDLVFPHHELGAAEASVLSGEWPFARAFVHQAMVGYAGEKMSKSKGNLVLVSQLRAAGVDPMAIRLALLDHLHTNAWAWQDSELGAAADRLGRWRAALARVTAPPAESLVVPVRAALRDGLRTPDALVAVDEWCARDGNDAAAPRIAAAAIDALLGITG